MSIQLQPGIANEPLDRVLEDLLVRFVVNAPAEELATNSRVFFLFEEAHWYYLDHVRPLNPELPLLKMKSFCKRLIEVCPIIWHGGDPDAGLKEFVSYKQSIPVRGAALFNSSMTKLLLVQGVESNSWSFPRGKIGKDEDDADCAVREVKEEIGMDISEYLNRDDYIERTLRGKNYRIYVCRDVPEDYNFVPEVKNEIRDIAWMDFRKIASKIKNNNDQKFFLVNAMFHALQQWVKKNKGEYNETQLKLEVETQLKSMLGLKIESKDKQTSTSAVDPGRDLLDFIRKSSAEKHLKAVQQQIHDSKQLSSSQQSQPQPQLLQQQPPLPFPLQGTTAGGGFLPFPPPLSSGPQQPFMAGPLPFPLPNIHGMPLFANYTLPQTSTILHPAYPHPGHQHQQNPQFPQPTHELAAPNASMLARPSLSLTRGKNEEQSRELLSILNNANKSNAKDLLALFNKGVESVDSKREIRGPGKVSESYTSSLMGLLKKTPKQPKDEASNNNSTTLASEKVNDNAHKVASNASKDLLSLLKGTSSQGRSVSPISQSSSRPATPAAADVTTQRPKMKMLKRGETPPPALSSSLRSAPVSSSLESNASTEELEAPFTTNNDTNTNTKTTTTTTNEAARAQSPKPSKELLDLIKKTRERSKTAQVETFEEFSEEEYYDDNHDENEDEEVHDYDQGYEQNDYEDDYEQFDEKDGTFEVSEVEPLEYEPEISSVPAVPIDRISSPPVIKHFDNIESLRQVEAEKETQKLTKETSKPKKMMLLKRGQDLEQLIKEKEPEKEEGEDRKDGEEKKEGDIDSGDEAFEDASGFDSETPSNVNSISNASADLLNLLHNGNKGTSQSSTAPFDLTKLESNLDAIETRFDAQIRGNETASNELLNLLKPKSKDESNMNTTKSTTSNFDLFTNRPTLETLNRDGPPLPHSVNPLVSPPQQEHQTESQSMSQSLLSLLKRPSSSAVPEPSNQAQPTPTEPSEPPQPPQPEQASSPSSAGISPGNELLKMLHRPSPRPQSPQPSENYSNASNELLGLLHKKPTSQGGTVPAGHESGKRATDLLNMLHGNS